MPSPPSVVFQVPDGRLSRVHPGGIIGRMAQAALRIDDPRVSEAHALVSLRGRTLKLLALRSAISLRGRSVGEVDLRPGQEIGLAEDLVITVHEVVLPEEILALDGLGTRRVELDQPEWSIFADHPEPGFQRHADAWLWCSEHRWMFQPRDGDALEIEAGSVIELGGSRLRLVSVPIPDGGVQLTVTPGRLHPPLVITCWPQHTEIHVGDRPALVKLTRNAHSILRATAALCVAGGTVHWLTVAERIWPVNANEDNWYTNLNRLKDRLRDENVRPDLVMCVDGQVALNLRDGVDRVELR